MFLNKLQRFIPVPFCCPVFVSCFLHLHPFACVLCSCTRLDVKHFLAAHLIGLPHSAPSSPNRLHCCVVVTVETTSVTVIRTHCCYGCLQPVLVCFCLFRYRQHSLDTMEAYDPRRNVWIKLADMGAPCSGLGACALFGLLYTVGWPGGNHMTRVTCSCCDTLSVCTECSSVPPSHHSRTSSS